MTILVTGGAGFIGSAVVRRLIRETDHTVVTVDKLTYAGNRESLAAADSDPRHHFERVDICDRAALRRVFDTYLPAALLHLAAESHVDRSIDGPAPFIRTNILGTFTLLEEARRHYERLDGPAREAFRFIHVSTDEVFGSLAPGDARFTEATPYDPSSPYAASKAAADHLARAWQRTYGLPVIVTNSSNNYGPYQFPEKLIPLTILNGLEGRELPVYGRGENVRDWLHVDDHAAGLIAALERGEPGETYALSGDCERSNIAVVRAICALLDELAPDLAGAPRERLIRFVEDRPGHDLRYAIDAGHARDRLAWAPSESLESGLRATVAWYIEHRDWWGRIRTAVYGGERIGIGAM